MYIIWKLCLNKFILIPFLFRKANVDCNSEIVINLNWIHAITFPFKSRCKQILSKMIMKEKIFHCKSQKAVQSSP